MKDDDKTKEQFIHELEEMRRRVVDFERSEGERRQRGEEPQKRE